MSPAQKIVEASACSIPAGAANAFAGDVSARDAWEAIRTNPHAMLVDVRTPEEWRSIGIPDAKDAVGKVVKVSWKLFPNYTLNQDFAAQFRATGATEDTPLYFLCRSGGRSTDAAIAMTAAGYRHCHNIAGGFEGRPDDTGRRGTVEGWKADGLPWRLA